MLLFTPTEWECTEGNHIWTVLPDQSPAGPNCPTQSASRKNLQIQGGNLGNILQDIVILKKKSFSGVTVIMWYMSRYLWNYCTFFLWLLKKGYIEFFLKSADYCNITLFWIGVRPRVEPEFFFFSYKQILQFMGINFFMLSCAPGTAHWVDLAIFLWHPWLHSVAWPLSHHQCDTPFLLFFADIWGFPKGHNPWVFASTIYNLFAALCG